MSIQVTEIEIEYKEEDHRTISITVQRLGDSIIIRDTHGHVSMPEEMIGDLIKALNIFKCD